MKKGIILDIKRFKLLDYVTQNKILIILSVLYILGIVISTSILADNNSITNSVNKFLKEYISLNSSATFIHKFFNFFLRYFVILILYFISSTSIFGVALTPFITLWQGITFGAISSRLYTLFGINGVAFNAVIVIPPAVIFIITCFFAAKYALDFSLSIAKLTLPHTRPINLCNSFKMLSGKYLIFLVISIFCTLLEIILNLLFLKFFNF